MTNVQIVVVEPNKLPYKKMIPNTLEAMQGIVGGYIENLFIGERTRIALILNEEGKLKNLPFNRHIVDTDLIMGTFFIAAFDLEGEMVSLSDDETNKFISRFAPLQIYLNDREE